MKLNRIAAICKKVKIAVIFNRRDENGEIIQQWIGDGGAFYFAEGMPIIDSQSLGVIFNIPAKDAAKWKIMEKELPESYDFTDDAEKSGERIFDEDPIYLQCGGVTLKPLRSDGDVPVIIDAKYLTPFDDTEYMALFRRTTDEGADYVAVKIGMCLAGIIAARKMESGQFVRDLRALTEAVEQAAEAAEKRKEKE